MYHINSADKAIERMNDANNSNGGDLQGEDLNATGLCNYLKLCFVLHIIVQHIVVVIPVLVYNLILCGGACCNSSYSRTD